MENEKQPLDDLKNDEITEKLEKWVMHTVGTGKWQENWQRRKMRKTPGRNRNMASNIEKREKLEIYTVGPGIWQENLKNVENEKHTL